MKLGVGALFGAVVIGLFAADAGLNRSTDVAPLAAAPEAVQPAPEAPDVSTGDFSEHNAGAGIAEPDQVVAPRRGPSVLVSRVIDGDAIEVLLRGQTTDVRLIGIDTPETVHPSVGVECYGPAASRFTERRLEGRQVTLEFDVERKDRYGRTLAYVWTGGELFNRVLVASGFAQVSTYPPNVQYVDRFLGAERNARAAGRGLWSGCGAEPEPAPAPQTAEQPAETSCTPGYDPCLPPASDYDCAGGSGDGPEYTGRVRVTGDDPYGLDSDGDGYGCE
ncbi:MAG: thermonuclease family protein [Actinomycetota bacterium]